MPGADAGSGALLLGLDLRREMQAARERLRLREAILTEWNDLPEEKTLDQADYGDMIRKLGRQLRQETATQEAQRQDMLDYYTTWVHQIKTPMAVMKLYLGTESPEHRAMGTELFPHGAVCGHGAAVPAAEQRGERPGNPGIQAG